MQESGDRRPNFLEELKRRRVVRLALGYGGAAIVLLQGVQLLVEASVLAPRTFRVLVVLCIVGFPAAILMGWFFDVTPEGVRLTGRERSAGPVVARLRPRTLVLAAGVALAATLGALMLWRSPGTAAGGEEVEEGAAIAILPFATSGAGVGTLEQGLTDLLSRSLNGVGSIRVVDTRAVLARWKEATADQVATPEEKLSIAAESGASMFLTGSVVAVQSRVRINANLFGLDGTQLASVKVDGFERDMLALVDSVSLGLLREILRSSRTLPAIDVSAITSSDIEAVRAFLVGERYYRAAAWEQALAAFTEATQRDSLFALAYYRAASASGWAGGRDAGRASIDRAVKLLPRLPVREQTLVRAAALRTAGDAAAAVDTMSAYLERYPNDPEATFLMSDDLYHLQTEYAPLNTAPADEALWLFERTLSLDPSFTPALIHPLEVAFRSGDAALARRYLPETLEHVPAVDREAVTMYRAALRALEHPRDVEAIQVALERALARRAATRGLAWQVRRTVMDQLIRQAAALPEAERASLARTLSPRRARGTEQDAASRAHFTMLLSGGKLAEARDVLRRAAVDRTIDRKSLARLAFLPVLAGYSDSPLLTGADGVPASGAAEATALLLRPLDRNDAAGVRRALPRIAQASVADTALRSQLVHAGAGFARMLEGDTVAGLREVEAVLEGAGFIPGTPLEAVWERWLARAALHADTRERSLAILARPWPGSPVFDVVREYDLARALEAAGRRAEAEAAYRRFANALSDADPELGAQPRVRQARAVPRRTAAP